MRVEITEGKSRTARVVGADWTVSATQSGGYISVWYRGQHLTLGGDASEIVETWARVREALGEGLLVQDLRDALAACRRELDRHDGYSSIRPRSNFERFVGHVVAGDDVDDAARSAGGTGRPERRAVSR